MKIKKLQKLVVKSLMESGVTEGEEQLRDKLMHKISSSTRFTIEDKRIRLVAKIDESWLLLLSKPFFKLAVEFCKRC